MSDNIEEREIAIEISGVKKQYKLGQIGGGTLFGDLQSWWARIRGKEDPSSQVGSKAALNYGKRFMALDGIDLTIYKGEALGIIGHNGAGKSTLLKLLNRVTAPTGGEIGINGRIASMLEVGTGFNGYMTGRENVYMNGAILGMTKAEIDSKMDKIIEFSEVGEFIDTPVRRYSSGMYVKLAFSVAAHLDSEIMIMDEVLAVGDMAFQKKCLEKMRGAAKLEGRTVLYVSHNMNTIRQLCDRCIVLDKGKIIFDGDVEKAIKIYMNSSIDTESVSVDLSEKDRPRVSTNKAQMLRIERVGASDCVVERGKKFKIKLRWLANKDVSDVRFRIMFRNDFDIPVGVFQSPVFGSFKAGEIQQTVFEFDTTYIAEGEYCINIALFQSDEVGNSVILDHIARGYSIHIINPVDETRDLVWLHRWWGSARFPDMEVISSETEKGNV